MTITESTIEEILRSEDIESLFQHGAPRDEYAHQARGIMDAITRMGQDLNEEGLIAIISDVWSKSFPFSNEELKTRMPAFQQVANRIIFLNLQHSKPST